MGVVVRLSGVRLGRSDPPVPDGADAAVTGFSRRDRQDLAIWSRGGRRAVICADDLGAFAMLHDAGRCWASWGVTRQSRGILLWNCVSLADVGYYPTVAAALAATAGPVPASKGNVVSFRSRVRRPLRRRTC